LVDAATAKLEEQLGDKVIARLKEKLRDQMLEELAREAAGARAKPN
jgi:hypothetical protein